MDILQTGQKLSINFQKEEVLVEITALIDKIYDDRVVIDLPSYFMRYIDYLEAGKSVTVKVFSKIGTIDFNAIIITSPLEEEFSVELDYNAMKMTPADEIPAIKAVETLQCKNDNTESIVKTFEISTNFIKFYSDKPFELEESFKCSLILPSKYGTISFTGIVIEVDEIYTNEYKMSITSMSQDDRQLLLYYMYVYSNNTD